MDIKKTITRICAGMLAAALSVLAHATGAGFYAGIMLGQANLNNIARDVVAAPNPPQTCPGPTCASDFNVAPSNTGLAERLFLGSYINEYAGIEMGYSHYTASSYNTTLVNQQIQLAPQPMPAPPTPATAVMLTNTPTIRESAIDLGVKIMYPFSKFDVFGKLGMSYNRRSMSGSLTNQASDPTAKRNGTVNQLLPQLGVGVSYDFTPRWVLDFSINETLAGANDYKAIRFYAVGISYHIVTLYCGQFIC